jgi:argininosuccinate lyase
MSKTETLAVGRLGVAPDVINQRDVLGPMLTAETALLGTFIDIDIAHAVMLVETGILAEADGGAILKALLDLRSDPRRLQIDPEFDSLLLQIERHLNHVVGDVAGRLHTGRSRNDQGSTAERIFLRDALLATLDELTRLQLTVLEMSSAHVTTLMPGYTHLQHAQPTTLAHYLMRHQAGFERDQSRLEAAFERVNRNALGLAAMAGTAWPLDRVRTAELLGHDGLVDNGQDAGIFNSDLHADVVAALSLLVANLARPAFDLYLWSTYEFGMVEVPDGLAGTSSIMPQKKNPHSLERIIGVGGLSVGWLPAILGATRGSSSDLSLTFAAPNVTEMFEQADGSIRLLDATLSGLVVHTDRMRARAHENWATASNLADTLVREAGISFRAAHQVVGRTVRQALTSGLSAADIRGSDVDRAAREILGLEVHLSDEVVRNALDPEAFITSRVTPGGTQPEALHAAIEAAEARQEQHRRWSSEKRGALQAAEARRFEAARTIVGRL